MLLSKPKFTTTVFLLTLINYFIAYLLSSREILMDYKNLALIFLFTTIWVWLSQKFKSQKAFIALYISSCILGFVVPYLSYLSEAIFLQRLMKDFLFWYALPLALITPITWINVDKNKRLFSIIASTIFTITLIPVLSIVVYYLIFGTQISTDSILAILQTNKQESIEFLSTYLSTLNIVLFICFIIIITLAFYKLHTIIFSTKLCTPPLHKRNFFIFLNIILAISCVMFAEKSYFARSLDDALKRNAKINNFSAHSKDRIQKLHNDSSLKFNAENGNFALVIGETHARSNMSAYGYQRNTTPWLTSASKKGDVLLLQNSFSNAGVTTGSLEYALSAMNQYNDITYEKAITITEIAQASGFNVIWIRNQIDDNIAGIIGHEAKQQYWLNQKHNDTWMRQKNNMFDDKILQCLETLPAQTSKTLFVINLLGSHASYDCRYPDSFNKWNDKESLLNAYDNSVLFNDYVMSEIYKLLFNKFNISGMVYFADHGEELKLKFCHGNEYFYENYKKYPSVKEIVKIPVYFAFSKKYQQQHPEIINALKANSDKYFTNDMIYDTMLGLMHIPEPYYNSKYDISSNTYNMPLSELRTLHGKVKIEDCL